MNTYRTGCRIAYEARRQWKRPEFELGISARAPSMMGGAQQIALWEQCPGSLVEVTWDEWR